MLGHNSASFHFLSLVGSFTAIAFELSSLFRQKTLFLPLLVMILGYIIKIIFSPQKSLAESSLLYLFLHVL